MMRALTAITAREFAGYFATPLAFVFIIVFLLANGLATFYLGAYFAMGQADLTSFFMFHPWLYLFFLPAISMRLWAEERRNGSIELLLTLPIPLTAVVIGNISPLWPGLGAGADFPGWLTVNFLGIPIIASFLLLFWLADAPVAILHRFGLSALTRNQVIAFVISVVACFLFTVSGAPLVLELFDGWAPQALIETLAGFSLLTHFRAITGGVIDMRDVMFFATLIGVFLTATVIVVDMKKAEGA